MKKYDNTILFLIMIFLNIIIILIQASSSLPHVYYINLDRAFKRNQNMKHYLTEYGFNYTRIEAFDGKDFVHDIALNLKMTDWEDAIQKLKSPGT